MASDDLRDAIYSVSRTYRLCAMTSEGDFRIERDTMGDVLVPARALWKAQTQRAVENSRSPAYPSNRHCAAWG